MMIQLDPPVPLVTPKGKGMAHLVLDYGTEYSLIWATFIDETGECYLFRNEEVRLQTNWTFGRFTLPDAIGSKGWNNKPSHKEESKPKSQPE